MAGYNPKLDNKEPGYQFQAQGKKSIISVCFASYNQGPWKLRIQRFLPPTTEFPKTKYVNLGSLDKEEHQFLCRAMVWMYEAKFEEKLRLKRPKTEKSESQEELNLSSEAEEEQPEEVTVTA